MTGKCPLISSQEAHGYRTTGRCVSHITYLLFITLNSTTKLAHLFSNAIRQQIVRKKAPYNTWPDAFGTVGILAYKAGLRNLKD